MKRAFTLIELLVVIAIIAILAAILFPVFAQAKLAAKASASLSNTKQLATASMIYTTDSDDFFVAQYVDQTGPWGWQETWVMKTLPYMKNYEILKSPTDTVPLVTAYNSGPKFSYVANGLLLGNTGSGTFWLFRGVINTNGNGGSTGWYERGIRSQTEIPRVAEAIMFGSRSAAKKGGDKDPYAAGGSKMEGSFSPWNAVLTNASSTDCASDGCTLPGWVSPWGLPVPAYKGGLDRNFSGRSPMVYADTHAKNMNPDQTVDFSAQNPWGQIGFINSGFAGQWDALRP